MLIRLYYVITFGIRNINLLRILHFINTHQMNEINEQTKFSDIIGLFSELNEIRNIHVQVKYKGICVSELFQKFILQF